jgi:probable rRNA maturation factor
VALAHPKLHATPPPTKALPAQIGVRVVGREEGQEINAQYRQKSYATNVLTFPYALSPQIWADVVLCAPVLKQESEDLGLSLEDHCSHLLVHACLHAMGFDHELGKRQEREMESLEVLALNGLGVANPYALAAPKSQRTASKRPLGSHRNRTPARNR